MASFLHILKDIGKTALIIDQAAAPFVSMINPAVGSAMNAVAALVVRAEQTYPSEGQGATKKAAVLDWFFALYPMIQEGLKAQGYTLTIDQNSVSQLIDATCAQLNAAALLKNGFKIEKLSQ